MLENRFYKVSHQGGSYVTATLFNPVTKEYKTICVRDYDYSDGSRDNDEYYYMEIDEEARREWLHFNNIICEGDVIEVVKGRTLPHGFRGTVRNLYDYKDRYGRYLATYAYFEEGGKINVSNCKLVV